MLCLGAVAIGRAVDMFCFATEDAIIGMGGMLRGGAFQGGQTFCRMHMTKTADDVVTGIAVGVICGDRTGAGGLKGQLVIISCIIYINDG